MKVEEGSDQDNLESQKRNGCERKGEVGRISLPRELHDEHERFRPTATTTRTPPFKWSHCAVVA
jgi:hypothetical protein